MLCNDAKFLRRALPSFVSSILRTIQVAQVRLKSHENTNRKFVVKSLSFLFASCSARACNSVTVRRRRRSSSECQPVRRWVRDSASEGRLGRRPMVQGGWAKKRRRPRVMPAVAARPPPLPAGPRPGMPPPLCHRPTSLRYHYYLASTYCATFTIRLSQSSLVFALLQCFLLLF